MADEAEDDVAVELEFGKGEAVTEVGGGKGRTGAVVDGDVEGGGGGGDADGDGTDCETVVGGEAEAEVTIEGGDWRRIRIRIRVWERGGEEEAEVVGADEMGGVEGVGGGETGKGGEWSAEREGEAAGSAGDVGAPELDVVEADDGETIGAGVDADEASEADEFKLLRGG